MLRVAVPNILNAYDVLFVDLWGVTHNGKVPFPGTLAVFQSFKEQGKHVYLLSNAPRMPQPAKARLQELGVDRGLYKDLLTSGYECHKHLKNRPDDFYKNLGKKVFHLGPERDKNLFTDLDYEEVTAVSEADFVLITGTEKWDCQLSDYAAILEEALACHLPTVCANPDLQVFHGSDLVICSGAIAKEYERMGGYVRYHGKPDPSVYEVLHKMVCEQTGQDIPKEKILMIGDSLRTDILGANRYGIDSLLVLTGIHGGMNPDQLRLLCEEYGAFPTHIADAL